MLKIGSHVSFGKEQLYGSVKEALSYGSTTFMFYTGAPQNTRRSELDEHLTEKACNLMKENNISLEDVVCHAPYIVNLANNKDADKYRFSIEFLTNEIKRCETLGITKLVLHPGSSVGLDETVALKNIIYALNLVLESDNSVTICLETMAGKGSELGKNLEEMKTLIEGIDRQELIGVCLDTCHLNDAGIDISKWNDYINEFDREIGIDKIKVIHVNDSKNAIGSHKDRHENIGCGHIGFDSLINVIYDERFSSLPKILETPYVGNSDDDKERIYPPYKFEIDMIRKREYNENLKRDIRNSYN